MPDFNVLRNRYYDSETPLSVNAAHGLHTTLLTGSSVQLPQHWQSGTRHSLYSGVLSVASLISL